LDALQGVEHAGVASIENQMNPLEPLESERHANEKISRGWERGGGGRGRRRTQKYFNYFSSFRFDSRSGRRKSFVVKGLWFEIVSMDALEKFELCQGLSDDDEIRLRAETAVVGVVSDLRHLLTPSGHIRAAFKQLRRFNAPYHTTSPAG
jgi:hypothetical protein